MPGSIWTNWTKKPSVGRIRDHWPGQARSHSCENRSVAAQVVTDHEVLHQCDDLPAQLDDE